MGVRFFVGEDLDIFLHRCSAVEYRHLDFWNILAESCKLVFDLVRKFAGVRHNQDRAFARNWFYLLQRGEDEDSGLSETRFSLAENIGSKDGLRNANLLDCEKAMPMSDLYRPRNM